MKKRWNVWEGASHVISCSSAEGEKCCAKTGESDTLALKVPSLYTVWAVNMELMNKSVLLAAIQN